MRALTSVPNIDGATTDYPNGRVRDKLGVTPGTTGGEVLFGDIIQLFQKMVIDGGISPNGNPDNVTNGYQLLEALRKQFGKSITKDAVAGDLAYTLEFGISNVLTFNYEGGRVKPTLPLDARFKNTPVTFTHVNGNYGAIVLADFTNLTIGAGHPLNGKTFVGSITVLYDGTAWHPVSWSNEL